ncbi:hypothetical protein C1Y40_03369 [Mycobacterium talmoniae]|uniref:Uncharacterized protein n=1 Tax=Mycobacterium talmoniae TaxID=1858794 RepID=A0A2S8BIK1_9MYCO|nr:hypothetical protein C1Y40_03369 [Mycobacterium talmoniae]
MCGLGVFAGVALRGPLAAGVPHRVAAGVAFLRPRERGFQRQRQRFAAPGVVEPHQLGQRVAGLWRRPEQPLTDLVAIVGAPDAVGGPVPAGMLGGQRQQRNPGLQQVGVAQLGVVDRHRGVPEHRGDGAGEPTSAAEIHVDVVGVRFAEPIPARRGGQPGGAAPDLFGRPPAQLPGRQAAAPPLGVDGRGGVHAAQHVVQHPIAHRPLLAGVDLHRHVVADLVDVEGQRVVQGPEKALDRVLEEPEQIGQRDIGGLRGRQRIRDEHGCGAAGSGGGLGGQRGGRVEGERRTGDQRARLHGLDVERLQRMVYDDPVAHRGAGGVIQGVEQLGQRHRGRAVMPGVLVGAGVGDHQGVGGRADRVQQQLPVLGTDVAFAGQRVAGQHVVVVGQVQPREHPVVQAQ